MLDEIYFALKESIDVSDVKHATEHTKYANCDLNVKLF